MESKQNKGLRTAAVVLMGLTAAMNLLGGIGTVCAAFLTKNFPPMWVFFDYQLRYQILMIVTIIIGIICVWATMGLVRGGKDAYRNAVILLLVGSIVAGYQFYSSLQIRGAATPANVKFFTNFITLLVFLALKLPGVSERVDFSKPGGEIESATSGGLTAIVAGSIILTTPIWVGASHIFEGENWVDLLQTSLIVIGTTLTLGGLARIFWIVLDSLRRRRELALPEENA
jgi:FtsH-binding integral membrane protein